MHVQSIDYKQLVCAGSPFQSSYWAALKRGLGWKPYAFTIEDEDRSFSLLVLVKQVMPLCDLAYIPFGPDVTSYPDASIQEYLKRLARALKPFLPKTVFTLRFDLGWDEVNDENVMTLHGKRFKTCPQSIQPDATVRLDLSKGYERVALLYRERARRALRKAKELFSVVTWDGDPAIYKQWYEVYLETARRDGFAPRSGKYLKASLTLDAKVKGDVACKLLLAYAGQNLVGGIIVALGPEEAVYLYGASLRQDLGSCSTLLQDRAIELACGYGCKTYDFYGIAGPKGRGAHLAGLEVFKLSFGGNPYYRTPSTDYVYHRLPWRFYTISEWVRYRMIRSSRRREVLQPSS